MALTVIRRGLLATTVIAGALLTTPVLAQTATPEEPTADEGGIVVTGSRIARNDLEQASPVSVVTAEDIAVAQPVSIELLLRDLPGSAPGIGEQVNNGTNGTASFNLRGLGANRNLVLLNGRRTVPSTLANATDLNIIPVALIERSEIFTGGASTAYGADAVSGVVNFITKQNFTGVDLAANYGVTERGDGQSYRVDLTIGADIENGRGNVVLAASYTNTKSVLQGNRDFSDPTRQSTLCSAGQTAANPTACASTTQGLPQGSATAVPSSLFFPLPTDPAFVAAGGGRIDPTTGLFVAGLSDYNFAPLNVFRTPFDRWSVFGQARYEVTPAIEVYSEAFFTRSLIRQEIAPTGTFTNQFRVPLNNPFLTPAARLQLCGFAVAANNLPAGTDCPTAVAAGTEVTAIVARRFVETGPRVSTFVSNVFQVTTGVRGKITDTLNFDVNGQYGEARRIQTSTGQALAARVQQALRATSTTACTDGTGGCVPLNLFGAAGTITPQQLAFLGIPTNIFINTRFATASASINGDFGVSSPFAESPISVAVGAEFRRYAGDGRGDLPSSTPGAVLGAGGATPEVAGNYSSRELFGEINVPIVSDKPGFHELTFTGGIRYADYTTSGGNYTYKAGGSYSPIRDIKFRGVWSRAVRAPNIGELFSPVTTGLSNLAVDPCQLANGTANANVAALCTAQLVAAGLPASRLGSIPAPIAGQINTTGGGNPNLAPERATTITAGVVLQPSFLQGFSATVDWYRIRIRGAITSPTLSDILNGCFGQTNPNDFRCVSIARNPLTGGLSGDASTTRGVITQSSNLGFIESQGIDFSVAYNRDLGFARLNWKLNGNYTQRSRFQAAPFSFVRECTNFYSVSCDPVLPKFSMNMRTTLSLESFDASVLWRHISNTRAEPRTGATATTPPAPGTVGSFNSTNPASFLPAYASIPAYDLFDLSLGANVTDTLRMALLVENLFDKQPPLTGSTIGSTGFNSGNTFPSTYDALGRRYTVSVGLRF